MYGKLNDNGEGVELPHVVKKFWHVTIWVEVKPAETNYTKLSSVSWRKSVVEETNFSWKRKRVFDLSSMRRKPSQTLPHTRT